jgi:hypothetical protein
VSGSKFFAEKTAYRYLAGRFIYSGYDYGKAKIDNDLLKGDHKRNDIFFFAMNANWKL